MESWRIVISQPSQINEFAISKGLVSFFGFLFVCLKKNNKSRLWFEEAPDAVLWSPLASTGTHEYAHKHRGGGGKNSFLPLCRIKAVALL